MKKNFLIRLFILFLGAVLRFSGLQWSLPNSDHALSYHPDEQFVIRAALRLDLFHGKWDPGFYNQGGFFLYTTHLAFKAASVLGALSLQTPIQWLDPRMSEIFWITRVLSACFSLATILVVYWLGSMVLTIPATLIACLVTAIVPLLVYEAHFATVESAFVFWNLLSFALLVKAMQSQHVRWFFSAGIATGIAIATKYSALLLLIPVQIACILSNMHVIKATSSSVRSLFPLKKMVLLLSGVILGTLIFMPYLCSGGAEVWKKLHYEIFVHPQEGHGVIFEGTGNGFIYLLFNNLPVALGRPLWGATLLAFFLMIKTAFLRRKASTLTDFAILSLSWVVPFILILSFARVRFIRYLAPLCPLLCLWIGHLIHEVMILMKRNSRRYGVRILIIFVLLYTLAYAWAHVQLFLSPDTRDSALYWIRQNVPPKSRIATIMKPWFFSPPINPYNGGHITDSQFAAWKKNDPPFDLVQSGWNLHVLQSQNPNYVLLSSLEMRDPVRLKYPEAQAILNFLTTNYELAHAPWEQKPNLLGIHFGWPFAPHDWLYPNPTIFLFQRRPISSIAQTN